MDSDDRSQDRKTLLELRMVGTRMHVAFGWFLVPPHRDGSPAMLVNAMHVQIHHYDFEWQRSHFSKKVETVPRPARYLVWSWKDQRIASGTTANHFASLHGDLKAPLAEMPYDEHVPVVVLRDLTTAVRSD